MIIKGFKAKSVFGYLDFDINFNDDVSFVVGGNGSGKTTALKLMNALINPNFRDLMQTPFKSCSLELEFKSPKNKILISATRKVDEVLLSISTIKDILRLPSYSNQEFSFYSHREEKFDELVDEIKLRNAEHPVVKEISKFDSPIFLGLDRRRDTPDHKQDYYLEREMWLHQKRSNIRGTRRYIKGSIGASLMDTELLVQNSYKRIRELESKQSNKLRDKILLSAFKFSKFEEDDLVSDIGNWQKREMLITRQKEIKEAISNIVGHDSAISEEVDKFFLGMRELFGSMSQNKEGLALGWIMNKAQIERMASIVDIIDEHKSKVDRFYKPINSFLDTINNFFKDSKKYLKVDAVGQLVVQRPDGNDCTIEGLSSGERQLLVIFAHTFFNKQSTRKNIFIIDEPELSLHLGWQEKFAATIFSANPSSQFIMATHSPEIVAGNKDKAVWCRK